MKKRIVLCVTVIVCFLWLPTPGEGTDFNGDGQVDFADFILFATGYQKQDAAFDLNADGVVGFGDFLVFARVYAASGREIQVSDMQALNKAIASAQAGDRIVMANGTWRDADILFAAVGDAGRPITIVAQTPGQVILTGTSRLRFSGRYIVNVVDAPIGAKWEGNMFGGGDIGINVSGISTRTISLTKSEGLFRPVVGSMSTDGAVGVYGDVTGDVDGQARMGKKDVGCDEQSDVPVVFKPLERADVGPVWLN